MLAPLHGAWAAGGRHCARALYAGPGLARRARGADGLAVGGRPHAGGVPDRQRDAGRPASLPGGVAPRALPGGADGASNLPGQLRRCRDRAAGHCRHRLGRPGRPGRSRAERRHAGGRPLQRRQEAQ
eukprot:9061797-Lingulodinium_polyedra.AAC.1